MRAKDLRERSIDDLRELAKSLAGDAFQNRFKNFTNRLDDTSSIKKARRDLARVYTLLREEALGLKRVPGEAAAKPAKAKKAPAPKAETKAAAPKATEAEGAEKKTTKKAE
jgi:large subunit ribosomal protein L29